MKNRDRAFLLGLTLLVIGTLSNSEMLRGQILELVLCALGGLLIGWNVRDSRDV